MYAECVSGAVVGDDCVVLVEGVRVSGSNDIMDADESCAKSIGDDRELVLSDMSLFFDWCSLHVPVPNGSSRGCGSYVFEPTTVEGEVSPVGGGHHCASV